MKWLVDFSITDSFCKKGDCCHKYLNPLIVSDECLFNKSRKNYETYNNERKVTSFDK